MGCLFCQFINGKVKEHKKGYPFIVINETKHTLLFVSLDSPVNDDAHFLIVPKKHYKDLHQIPLSVKADLIDHVGKVGKILNKKHGGYNVLLNNGSPAGQSIMHTHFHLIPRTKGDKIRIEIWERGNMSPKEFIQLCEASKKEFSKN